MNSKLNLYEHNKRSYKKIEKTFLGGEKVVGIVHATGTGKTYNALQLAYDNRDKKITYVAPSIGIIEHIKNIIMEQNLEEEFSHVEFRTYQSFVNMSKDEIKELNIDMLILDEFHHLGAPVWGSRIDTIIETHPNMQIFGMTAYTVRDRGTAYERDMANPDGDELFSNKIVSKYDLCDAMIEGVLPKPIYKTARINLLKTAKSLEEKLNTLNKTSKDYEECKIILDDVKKRISEAPSIKEIVKKNVKPDGKYIYFCPPMSEDGINDIDTIKKEAYEWFKEYVDEKDIIFYTTTSDMGEEGKRNREAFYNDQTLDGKSADGKLRIMFAINQYNEGIHAPNVDGVIMGRKTSSDIVYYEELGRALAVRGDTKDRYKEYEKLTKKELIELCNKRDILLPDTISKEDIIEKLLSPVVIDLSDNYDFIKNLENNLRDRIKEIQKSKSVSKLKLNITDYIFDIEVENQDLYEMLRYVTDRLNKTWEDWYNLAEAYYKKNNNLEIPDNFKTINGYEYDSNGLNLGKWITNHRQYYKNNRISEERIKLLEKIGMRFEVKNNEEIWQKNYEKAFSYYKKYKKLDFSAKFIKEKNVENVEEVNEIKKWIALQRKNYSKGTLSEERIKLLKEIEMDFKVKNNEEEWIKNYNLAVAYYKKYKNLEIPSSFVTKNGVDISNEKDAVKLGNWISNQRQLNRKGKLSVERIKLLEKIGMRFEVKDNDKDWENNFKLAEAYYKKYNDLEVNWNFKTKNGIDYDEEGINLGQWIHSQRKLYKNKKLTKEQIEKLESIKMRFKTKDYDEDWQKFYTFAKECYELNGNSDIPENYILEVEKDENKESIKLGAWLFRQRRDYKAGKLSPDRIKLLEKIEMRFEMKDQEEVWKNNYDLAEAYYEKHGNLEIKTEFITVNGYDYDETGVKLGKWLRNQRSNAKNQRLSDERIFLLNSIGMIWDVKQNKDDVMAFCEVNEINYEKNKDILEHISYWELVLKSEFLFNNNLPLTINGKLLEIFAMKNKKMKKFYGVNLGDLVKQYSNVQEIETTVKL